MGLDFRKLRVQVGQTEMTGLHVNKLNQKGIGKPNALA